MIQTPDFVQRLAGFEASLTAALFALGRDVAVGRTTPASLDARWKARRQTPDLVAALSRADDGDLKTWPDSVRPPHPEYAALQKALIGLYAQQEKGGWTSTVTTPSRRLFASRFLVDVGAGFSRPDRAG